MKNLRCALPKGRLQNNLLDLLKGADISFTSSRERNYTLESNIQGLEGKLLKARAIPQLVAMGNYEFGFCGLDLVKELDSEDLVPLFDSWLNPVNLVIASKPGFLENLPKRPIVIATEYEKIASRWAMSKGLAHIILQTWGSTEAYVPEDADIILDSMETGTTLSQNGLVVLEHVMESTTYLVVNKTAYKSLETRLTVGEVISKLREQYEY